MLKSLSIWNIKVTQTQSQEKENLNCKQHTLEKCGHFTNVESDLQSVFTFSHAACNKMMDTPCLIQLWLGLSLEIFVLRKPHIVMYRLVPFPWLVSKQIIAYYQYYILNTFETFFLPLELFKQTYLLNNWLWKLMIRNF